MLLLVPEFGERKLLPIEPGIGARTLLPARPEEGTRRTLLPLEPEIEERVLLPLGRETGVRVLLPLAPETSNRISTPPSLRDTDFFPGVLGDDFAMFESTSVGACTTMLGVVEAEILFACVVVGAGRAKGFAEIARRFPCCRLFAKMAPMDSSHHLGKDSLPMIIFRVSKSGISCLNLQPCCA